MTTTTATLASQKQIDFIHTLLNERELTETNRESLDRAFARGIDKREASDIITWLMSLPKKVAASEVEAGVYETPSKQWFRVYLGQQSGKMLVKEIHAEHGLMGDMEVSYEYLGVAAKHLPADARRMSLEEVGQLGIATNHCMICGRRLDDPESVDRGIGPVCAKNY